MSSFSITSCFQKDDFQAFHLVILNFELPSAFLYAPCELLEKQTVLCGNNSVWEIMYSTTRVNQFEMRDTGFYFLIKISQGNNVKLKYNLKINLQRLQSCLVLSRHIHNPVKQVKTVKYRQQFLLKASSLMYHWVLNTSPIILSLLSIISSTLNQ